MTPPPVSARDELTAKLSCAYAGAVWGVFWIPLRALEDAGMSGTWPTVLFFLVPAVLALPLATRHWRRIVAGGIKPQLMGVFCGCAIVIYSNSVIYTEVIRAMLLYYMTPIWSILLARLWLGEAIALRHVIAIIIGITGMAVILNVDDGFPWPHNLGDWFGLASGVIWAIGAVLLRASPNYHAIDLSWSFLFWSAVCGLAIAFMPFAPAAPDLTAAFGTLPWLIPTTLVIVFPAVYAVMWGAPKLNPGVVGLFFLTEIAVGAITAAIWADEPFGTREVVGVILISLAGVVEILYLPVQRWVFGRVVHD